MDEAHPRHVLHTVEAGVDRNEYRVAVGGREIGEVTKSIDWNPPYLASYTGGGRSEYLGAFWPVHGGIEAAVEAILKANASSAPPPAPTRSEPWPEPPPEEPDEGASRIRWWVLWIGIALVKVMLIAWLLP